MSEYIKKEDAIKEATTWSMYGKEVSKILKTADEQEKQGFIQAAKMLRELVK